MTAMGVLREGLAAFPNEPDLLLLASRVARLLSAPLLSLRYLDEAAAAMASHKAGDDALAELAAERMELAFLRLKMRMDPDRIAQAEREANRLRVEFAHARGQFGAARFKLDDGDIDFVLAGGMVDAGQIDKAAPLLLRARRNSDASVDVTRQLANLSIKRGEPQKAIALLRQALDFRESNAPAEDTIPYVEGQAKLSFLLGNAYEVTADLEDARKAWSLSARGWERLRQEQLRRKTFRLPPRPPSRSGASNTSSAAARKGCASSTKPSRKTKIATKVTSIPSPSWCSEVKARRPWTFSAAPWPSPRVRCPST
jgi:tetratricopeptide (TPR) repeat protein